MDWKGSCNSPPLSELASYQIFLCAGSKSASDYDPLKVLVTDRDFAAGNNASADFTIGLGANVENAYFLKMISAATGGLVINYSGRFTLQSVDGTFPPTIIDGLKTVSGTAGSPTENDIQAAASSSGVVASTSTQFSSTTAKSIVPVTTSHPSTTSTSSSTSTFAMTSVLTAQGTSLGAGAGAGIAIGGVVLLLASAFGIYYFITSRRRASSRAGFMGKPELEDTSVFAILRRHKSVKIDIHEMPADEQIYELPPNEKSTGHGLEGKKEPPRQISAKELPP